MTTHRIVLATVFAFFFALACAKKQEGDSTQNGNSPTADGSKGCTKISGPNFSNHEVCYEVLNGKPIWQGDIKLANNVRQLKATEERNSRNATILSNLYRDYYWPTSQVIYEVGPGLDPAKIKHALDDLQARSGGAVTFVAYTNQTGRRIKYIRSAEDAPYCGISPLGIDTTASFNEIEINAAAGCETDRVIEHETLHSLGFMHEQSRPDRDNFVVINWANVMPGLEPQFDKDPVVFEGAGPYDFESVMHYSRTAFSKNGGDTIVALTENDTAKIGRSVQASQGDINAIKTLYSLDLKVDVVDTGANKEKAARVRWTTQTALSSKVKYGLNRDNLDQEVFVPAAVTAHDVMVTGLTPQTKYFYMVESGSGSSLVQSVTRQFITDVTAPQFLDARVASQNGNQVEIRIGTNEPTQTGYFVLNNATLDFGFVFNSELTRIHIDYLRLSSEGSFSIYPFIYDESGNYAEYSGVLTVNNDHTAPVISSINVNRGATSAVITWNTNEPASSKVYYGTSSGSLNQNATGSSGSSHSVSLSGLSNNTTYFYKLESTDASGNTTLSTERSFSTDVLAPTLSNISASPATVTAVVSWNTSENADSKVEYGTSSSNLTLSESNSSYVMGRSLTLSNLSGGTLYYYRVRSKDAAGNEAVSAISNFTTQSIPAPVISSVSVSSISTNSAVITWYTDIASDSIVNYSTTSGNLNQSSSSGGQVTYHSVTLTNLSAGTSYFFRATSAATGGPRAQSSEISFTTSSNSGPDTVNITYVGYNYYGYVNYVQATSSRPNGGATTMTAYFYDYYGYYIGSLPMSYNSGSNNYSVNVPSWMSPYIWNFVVASSQGGYRWWY